MPIATQADIEAVRGPEYVSRLLDAGADCGSATGAADRAARLAEALQAGDDLLAQFLPDIDAVDVTDPRYNVLRRFAVDEALYYLQRNSSAGAADQDHDAAMMRRRDLAYMRKREQFPGTPEKIRTATPALIASANPLRLDRMRGFV